MSCSFSRHDPPPCDIYLWGRLKNAVYKTNPRTLEEQKRNIRDKINNLIEEIYRELWEIL